LRPVIILSLPCGDKNGQNLPVKNWELVADKLSASGWSWGCISAVESNGQTIWIVDAHRGDCKRFVMRADDRLTAFMALRA
jgi:hypothetical protein